MPYKQELKKEIVEDIIDSTEKHIKKYRFQKMSRKQFDRLMHHDDIYK